MIQQAILKKQQPTWQQALTELITDPVELLSLLGLTTEQIPWQWDKDFPLRVSKSFALRMKKGDPHDPLLKQVLSIKQESYIAKNYSQDPLKESEFNPVPGLLHKFKGRVLLTFTSSCAIHCRYCFRRHFPYAQNNPGRKGWGQALEYIAKHTEIFEIILSGGDPLMASDDMLSLFVKELEQIPHVKLLRFHTRLPVVIPERICQNLLSILKNTRLLSTFVYHINHANEIVSEITDGVTKLRQIGATVFNQAVLLADINDNEKCLIDLSLGLYKAGILPYYINLLDPVQGASHFEVPQSKIKELQQALREQLPGYLVPKFVKEVPHDKFKRPFDLIN